MIYDFYVNHVKVIGLFYLLNSRSHLLSVKFIGSIVLNIIEGIFLNSHCRGGKVEYKFYFHTYFVWCKLFSVLEKWSYDGTGFFM